MSNAPGNIAPVREEGFDNLLLNAGVFIKNLDYSSIADADALLVAIEALKAGTAKPISAAGDDLLIDAKHRVVLKLLHRLEITHSLPNGLKGFVRIDEVGQQREDVAGGDAFHRCGNLVLVIGTDVIELRVLFHILHVLFNPIEETGAPPATLFRSLHVAGTKAVAACIVQDVLVGHTHGR